jgi:hypothetical protein
MSENEEHGNQCQCGKSFENPEKLHHHIALHQLETEQEHTTRQPTRGELEEVLEWYNTEQEADYLEAVEIINECHYIIIENYPIASPTSADKILIEIASSVPSHYTLYTWKNGKIQQRNRAKELNQKGENNGTK